MALKLAQSDESVRPGWWTWAVWLEGTAKELDAVREVKYFLHPTFANPIVVVRDRSTSFRLDSSGWGEFQIRAEVAKHDGRTRTLTHDLELHVPGTSEPSQSAVSKVFLSYAGIDGRLGGALSRALESRGLSVKSPASVSPGISIQEGMHDALSKSHAFVTLESETPSLWQDRELETARALDKPIVRVRVGGPSIKHQPLQNERVLTLASNADPDDIADGLIRALSPGVRGAPKKRRPPARKKK